MELLPGARFSGLVGRSSWFPDHPGGPQFIWVLGPGISAPEFQPWKGRRPEEEYFKYPRGIIEKKISIFSKKATLILKSQFCQSLF